MYLGYFNKFSELTEKSRLQRRDHSQKYLFTATLQGNYENSTLQRVSKINLAYKIFRG